MKHKTENYDLLVEDWMPILRTNGKPDRVGIRQAILEAGTIRQIAATNPMDNVALLRLLLAVLQWCKPTLTDEERRELETKKRIRDDWLKQRLGSEKEPNAAFDLLGKATGFFQDETAWREVAGKTKTTKRTGDQDEGFRPVTDLLQELPSGTSVAHFRHTRDKRDGLCPACCAMGLVRLSAFASASKHGKNQQKPAGLNGATPVYATASGGSLLIHLRANQHLPMVRGDTPSWDDPNEPTDKDTIGPQRAFTWQPRRVWLERPDDGQPEDTCSACGERDQLVYRIAFLPGWKRPFEKMVWPRDPHVLSVFPAAQKKRQALSEPVMFANLSKPIIDHAQSWRKTYRGIIQRQISTATAQMQWSAIACVGAAANKALYQDVASQVFPSLTGNDQAIRELEWLDGIDLRNCMLQTAPKPILQRPEVTAALADFATETETALRERFEVLLDDLGKANSEAGSENAIGVWRNDVGQIIRAALEQSCILILPGSALRRRAAVQRARQVLNEAMEKAAR